MTISTATRTTLTAVSLLALTACASAPEDVAPAYVSPTAYAASSCADLDAELADISGEVARLSGEQEEAHVRDAVVMGVGLLLFWPALPLLAIPDSDEDLAQAKGEQAALRDAWTARGCAGALVTDAEGAA